MTSTEASTRLHSSRMHTTHSLTISPSISPISPTAQMGCLGPGGALSRGGAWSREGGIPACTEADPPWTEFSTHTSENITLSQSSFAGGNKLSTSIVARDMEMSPCNRNWVTKLSLTCNIVPRQIHFSGSSRMCKARP